MEETDNGIAQKKSSLLNKLIKLVLPLALGIVILYFLFKDIDFKEVWAILKEANWGILLISLPFGLLGNSIRGYRWKLFLKPLGYNPKVATLNYATYGGYAINFALPRAGELWKTGAVSKEEKIPFSKAFGTMLLDRIFDTATVLIITIFAFIFNMQFFIEQLKERQKAFDSVIELLQSPLLYIGLGAAVITTYVVFKFFSESIIIRKIREFTRGIVLDMKAIWKMDSKGRLLLYTVGIWGSYFLYFYITFFAFDFTEDLGFTAGLIAFALSSVSMGVPSNGGLGPWQVAVVAALTLYGVSGLEAKAFAVGVFGLQSLWVIICGFFGMGMLATRKSKE